MTIKIRDIDGDGFVTVALPYNFSYAMVSAPNSFETWWENPTSRAVVFGDYTCVSTTTHHFERDRDGNIIVDYYEHNKYWTYDAKYLSVSSSDIMEFDPIRFSGHQTYTSSESDLTGILDRANWEATAWR